MWHLSEVVEDRGLQLGQFAGLDVDGGVGGAQLLQVLHDLGLFVHLLLDEPGACLGVQARVVHERRQAFWQQAALSRHCFYKRERRSINFTSLL